MVGSSVGAILAAMASEQRPVRSLVFRAPAAYTPEMMQLSMAGTMTNEGRQFHEIKKLEDTPAGQAIKMFRGNLFVVASEKDVIIPPAITSGYLDIAKNSNKRELLTIERATHTLTTPVAPLRTHGINFSRSSSGWLFRGKRSRFIREALLS